MTYTSRKRVQTWQQDWNSILPLFNNKRTPLRISQCRNYCSWRKV